MPPSVHPGRLSTAARERVLGLGLALATTVVVALAAEGIARARQPAPAEAAFGPYITDWAAWDGDFYTIKSAAVGWPPWEDYNSEGLRDRERTEQKPEGVRRIACLGDSVTLGWGLPAEDAYPRVLQDRLDERGDSVEVLNVALGGWATRQERIAYRRIARRYAPDVVVLGLCLNDIPEMTNNLSRPPRWLAALHRHSALVRLVVDARGREIHAIDDLFRRPDAEAVRRGFTHVFDEIRGLRADVAADGARLVIVIFPYRPQIGPGFAEPHPQRAVARFCAQEGLTCLDLLPALRETGGDAFLDHVHLSALGGRRVAAAVLESGILGNVSTSVPPLEPPSPESLLASLGDGEAKARARAAWSLGALGGKASFAGSELGRALSDADPRVRAGAAYALGRLGPHGEAVTLALIGRLDDADPKVVFRAGDALAALGLGSTEVLPLLAVASRPESRGRAAAVEALGRIGAAAEAAVPALAAALGDPRTAVRGKAAWALGAIAREPRVAVPALVASLRDEPVASEAADALSAFGAEADAAVRPLMALLARASPPLRWRAALALGRIGDAAAEAAPALLAVAAEGPANVRLAALHALTQVRAKAELVLPVFERGLGDPDPRVRSQAARCIGHLGPAAHDALPALRRAGEDADPGVSTAARKAVERIEQPLGSRREAAASGS